MTNLIRRYVSILTLFAVVLFFKSTAFAQTSVIVEVRVLELSRTDLESLGGTIAKPAFAKQLSKSQADSLAAGPRSRVVHRFELPAVSGNVTQVRLDSRVAVTSSSSADVQTFFDAGIGIDVTPKVFQSRDISLATATQVKIRRGPDAAGVLQVVYENPFMRFDTRVHEGESIVLGGFITATERMTLPDMPMLPNNPILNYFYPEARDLKDRPEIAVLLTPRIVGFLLNADSDAPVSSKPAAVTPPLTSIAPPSAGSLAALPAPLTVTAAPVTTSPPVITSALPEASVPSAINQSPVVTSLPVSSAPASTSATAAADRSAAPTPPLVLTSTLAPASTSIAVNPISSPPPVITNAPAASNSTAAVNRNPVVLSAPVSRGPMAPNATAAMDRPPMATPQPVVAGTLAPTNNVSPEVEGTGGRYTVQVGAFDKLEKAEVLRAQLSKKYEMVFVEKLTTGTTPYRVRVGRFPNMQEARKIEKQLLSDGIDTYVTTLN